MLEEAILELFIAHKVQKLGGYLVSEIEGFDARVVAQNVLHIRHSVVHSLYSGAHHGWARRKIFKVEVSRCLENAILELFFEIEVLISVI